MKRADSLHAGSIEGVLDSDEYVSESIFHFTDTGLDPAGREPNVRDAEVIPGPSKVAPTALIETHCS
tara:strand:- start:24 stop:224 length:201 start_codon:yes stop_codon:yes gene_type:complete